MWSRMSSTVQGGAMICFSEGWSGHVCSTRSLPDSQMIFLHFSAAACSRGPSMLGLVGQTLLVLVSDVSPHIPGKS